MIKNPSSNLMGATLRTGREKAGFEIAQVAEQTGYTTRRIKAWEKGRWQPTAPQLLTLIQMYENGFPSFPQLLREVGARTVSVREQLEHFLSHVLDGPEYAMLMEKVADANLQGQEKLLTKVRNENYLVNAIKDIKRKSREE